MAGEIGYINLTNADLYFATRLSATAWTGIVDDSGHTTKTAALTTAYNRLFFSGLFDLPVFTLATAEQLAILEKAQCEMALYMLIHIKDEDRRKGLQAQGVKEAGIVKEVYAEADLMKLPIPPIVQTMLEEAGFSTAADPFYVAKVERDEDDEDMSI